MLLSKNKKSQRVIGNSNRIKQQSCACHKHISLCVYLDMGECPVTNHITAEVKTIDICIIQNTDCLNIYRCLTGDGALIFPSLRQAHGQRG